MPYSMNKAEKWRIEITMIKAVIFDMDGVIIDSEVFYLEQLYQFVKLKNPEATIDQLFQTVGRTKKDAWLVTEKAVNNGETWEELRDQFKEIEVFSSIDYRKIFRPEVKTVMEKLKKEKYQLALASSTHMELILHVLEVNGIRDYLDAVVSGEQFQLSKPDPEIYQYTAGRLGVETGECLVLEDSTVGITAASKAGMAVAALNDPRFGFDQSLADYQIDHVSDILNILQL